MTRSPCGRSVGSRPAVNQSDAPDRLGLTTEAAIAAGGVDRRRSRTAAVEANAELGRLAGVSGVLASGRLDFQAPIGSMRTAPALAWLKVSDGGYRESHAHGCD